MASQREWESVVWHFLSDTLKNTGPEEVKQWIFSYPPTTDTQEDRWVKSINKVEKQLEHFAGEGNSCNDECVANHYWEQLYRVHEAR